LLREKYGIDENGIFKGVQKMFEEGWSDAIYPSRAKPSVKRAFPNPK
jgi:hypothetical protein